MRFPRRSDRGVRRDRSVRQRRRRRAGGEAGYSLIEVLFAALLLVTAGGGLIRAMSAAALARRLAEDSGLAARIARSRMEELHAAPFFRSWPLSGYHPAVAPGGSADRTGTGTPGYSRWYDAEGRPAARREAVYQARWRIRELSTGGSGRLRSLAFEVIALPASGRGAVVRLDSVRVANRE